MADRPPLRVVDDKMFDPDQARAELVTWARLAIAAEEDPTQLHIADRVLQIDHWLSKGGYLPQDWTDAAHNGVSRGRSGL